MRGCHQPRNLQMPPTHQATFFSVEEETFFPLPTPPGAQTRDLQTDEQVSTVLEASKTSNLEVTICTANYNSTTGLVNGEMTSHSERNFADIIFYTPFARFFNAETFPRLSQDILSRR